MIPRCKITIIPISGPTEIDETLAEAVEAWNSQDGVSDVSEEIPVLVIDEPEDPDHIDDDNDDPRGDEQP